MSHDAPIREAEALKTSAFRGIRFRKTAALTLRFFLGQGSVQAIGILTSFYLLRALSIEAYAQFSFTMSFQQLAGLLMDLGFAGTVIPLVGSRRDDPVLVGRYIRAAKHLRNRMFLLIAPAASVCFLIIVRRHHWSWQTGGALLTTILVSFYYTGQVSYYTIPMLMHGRMGELYKPQIKIGLVRLFLLAVLRLAAVLNGATAAITGAVNTVIAGNVMARQSRKYLQWPDRDDPVLEREVFRYILPALPAMVFAAFQVQSAVFLIGIFGQTQSIAQVSALGRLNQIFALLTAFTAVVIEPFMAWQPGAKVLSYYLSIAAIGAGVCFSIVGFSFLIPGAMLWLLGFHYGGLQRMVGWAVLGGALNYLQTLIWILNRSRKWVFWRGTLLEIVSTLTLEVLYLWLHGVRSTEDAIYFSILCTFGPLASHIYVAAYGFVRDSRNMPGRQAGTG